MNGIDLIVLALLGTWLYFALRSMRKSKGACGCGSCGGNCAACHSCGEQKKISE